MRELRPARPPHLAGARTLREMARTVLTNSLVLYMAFAGLQRLWTLLNSDVLQLIRRVH
jgi:hypothetical protein